MKLTDLKIDKSVNHLNRSIFLKRKLEKTTKANESGDKVHTFGINVVWFHYDGSSNKQYNEYVVPKNIKIMFCLTNNLINTIL